jgi:RHS repeat-associated protein
VRWLASGRTVYNSKGLVVKQYEPFYADTPLYQPERAITERGVTSVRSYDPLGRVVRVDLPTGYHSRTEYEAWRTLDFDANDTDPGGPYADTPAEQWLDGWGRVFLILEHRRPRTPPNGWLDRWGGFFRDKGMADVLDPATAPLATYTRLDIDGNPTGIKDPRLFGRNQSSSGGPWNFETSYDMQGRPIRQIGADSGARWTLYNASGDEIQRWDARGIRISTEYDSFGRPTGIFVTDLAAPQPTRRQVERIDYGEYTSGVATNNLRGQVAAHYDQAGLLRFDAYSIDGEWIQRSRQVWSVIHKDPDYTRDSTPDGEKLSETRSVDALGRVVARSYPDGRTAQHEYHPSGRLRRLALLDGGKVAASAEAIDYNARGQRETIRYGNGLVTTCTYEPKTFYLATQTTTGPGGALQQLSYSYDPVGNISRAEDAAQNVVFTRNSQVLPRADYAYDALYRLTWAAGREQRGLYDAGRPQRPGDGRFLARQNGPNDGTALRAYVESYRYDEAGNLIEIRHVAVGGEFTLTLAVAAESNRAMPDDRPAGSAQPLDPRTAYDPAGNMLRLDHLRALGWDYAGRLASATIVARGDATADAEYYRYDGDGQRARKVRERAIAAGIQREETIYLDGYELRLVYNGANRAAPLERYTSVHLADDQGRFVTAHRWGVQRPGAPEAQARYQIGNHQGSVGLELSESGAIVSYEEYYPYGGTALIAGRGQAEVQRKEFGYTGRERDNATSLYYYGARYYAPWLGRWLSPDPAGPADGPNLYAYVRGNPVRFVDDGGLARTVISSQKAWEEFDRTTFSSKALATARVQLSLRMRQNGAPSARSRPALPDDEAGESRALSLAPAQARGDRAGGAGARLSLRVLGSKVATQSTVTAGSHTYTVLTKAATGPLAAEVAVIKTKAGEKATAAQIAKATKQGFRFERDPGRMVEGKLRKLREEYQRKIDQQPVDESSNVEFGGEVIDTRFALIGAIDTYFNLRDLPGAFGGEEGSGADDAGQDGDAAEPVALLEDGDGGAGGPEDNDAPAEADEHRHDD